MRAFFFCLSSLVIAQSVLAQGVPVVRIGSCPGGTSTQGGSCVPNGNTQVYWNDNRQCPLGWTKSQGYCVKRY